MKETCVVLYFLLLLVKGLLDSKNVHGYVGDTVTLSCLYSIKDETTSMCWGKGTCPSSQCTNAIIWTDGNKVTANKSNRYQLLGNITQGNVSLTISNISKKDEGTFCCRVEIRGLFNDEKHEINVKVSEAPKSTKPVLTTWSSGLTKASDYKHPEYRNITSTPITVTMPDTSNGKQQMVNMEMEEEATLDGDNVKAIIAGVVVFIILFVSVVGFLSIWKFHRIKNKNEPRNTGELTLDGLQAAQIQAEQNIYTL